MSIENSIEKTIKAAIARGEFDDLKGKGKPLDLSDYFNTPEEMRMAFAMLKSNEFVPEEVELMNEVTELRKAIADSPDAGSRAALITKLNEKMLSLNIALERYKRKR
jgi:hypothetical protein